MVLDKPALRPADPRFSSGPTKKRPGYTLEGLSSAVLGRSHRSKPGKSRLKEAIDRTAELLELPGDWKLGIVPASDTGAVEMAMWSMLGLAPVDVFAWESFGEEWVTDATKQLKLADTRILTAPYGQLPDLTQARPNADIIFTWNGTTSGVRVPNADWIADDRTGIVICDATSACFAQAIDWSKLDVVTFSWQKALGGEAAHGMIALSPRAVARLESYTPDRPIPKIFRLTKKGKLDNEIFEGSTINTPSMLCVEDWLDAVRWALRSGGLAGLIGRADANLAAVAQWVETHAWVEFLAQDPATRSNTSVCLSFVHPKVTALAEDGQAAFAKKVADLLDKEGVALDAAGYRSAPPGLRLWCGATVETDDVEAVLPWIEWAFHTALADLA